ncbi:hypothetical protein SNEBB_010642, partial [Seison nebaliae]
MLVIEVQTRYVAYWESIGATPRKQEQYCETIKMIGNPVDLYKECSSGEYFDHPVHFAFYETTIFERHYVNPEVGQEPKNGTYEDVGCPSCYECEIRLKHKKFIINLKCWYYEVDKMCIAVEDNYGLERIVTSRHTNRRRKDSRIVCAPQLDTTPILFTKRPLTKPKTTTTTSTLRTVPRKRITKKILLTRKPKRKTTTTTSTPRTVPRKRITKKILLTRKPKRKTTTTAGTPHTVPLKTITKKILLTGKTENVTKKERDVMREKTTSLETK